MLSPSLYEINTEVWLREASDLAGHRITLAGIPDLIGIPDFVGIPDLVGIPDAVLDLVELMNFDWVWLLGVWQKGELGRKVALEQPGLQKEYKEVLVDFSEADVCGSPFAIKSYSVQTDFGGDGALQHFRRRLSERGIRLLLDFVPNHTAIDHPWVYEHPEYYVKGTEEDLRNEPSNYTRVPTAFGDFILAHGRDPYFPGWTDTLQLNYRHPGLRVAMVEQLLKIAQMADGVRCDMAMLLLPEIILRTWGDRSLPSDGVSPVDQPFWPEAISRIRERRPDFCFVAEVYWGLESNLIQQGFDYTYDKRLYDSLRAQDAPGVREHLSRDLEFQRKSLRFLENHDELRAAAVFPPGVHQAAGVISFLAPGLHLFHDGQFQGRRARLPLQLARRPYEPTDPVIEKFYHDILECRKHPAFRDGRWQLLKCRPAWDGNPTWDRFIAFMWEGKGEARLLVTVNYGPTQGQCFVDLPLSGLSGCGLLLVDLMGSSRYEREGNDLAVRGLYLDMPAWGYHVFQLRKG
jgi:hypothetical protein